jgi:hypothetical protein
MVAGLVAIVAELTHTHMTVAIQGLEAAGALATEEPAAAVVLTVRRRGGFEFEVGVMMRAQQMWRQLFSVLPSCNM